MQQLEIEPPFCLPVTTQTLFKNANVFDGKSESLAMGMDVLIAGNKIAKISKGIEVADDVPVIDCTGKTLMPGLIDVHWHSVLAEIPMAKALSEDITYIALIGAKANRDVLVRGFTTVRDIGGNCMGIKKCIDEGLYEGPRIYPAGALICQTAGHFDFRRPIDCPSSPGDSLDYYQRVGMCLIADGVPEVLKRCREVLRSGATQLKLAAGGGVSSMYDPVDVAEFTFEELKAACDVAKTWNTYVSTHVFTDKAVQVALEAGVMSIEHGNLCREEKTFQMMKEKGAWFSTQPILNDDDAIPFPPGSIQEAKFIEVTDGTSIGIELAKKYGVKIAFGTDVLFDPTLAHKQGHMLCKMKRWFSNYEILKLATSTNAELVKMCGPRDPYPGAIGAIAVDALADIIVVDGNPLEDIELLSKPDENISVIMKDGRIYKNV